MTRLLNAVQFAATSSGTGDFVVSSAIQGFQTPSADGAINGETYSYRAQNFSMSEWEIGIGTWNSGTGTLARTTVLASSTGSKVSFTIPPNVGLTPSKDDLSNASTLFVTGTVPLARLPPLREVLTANRTYYVRTDGSNSNDGLSNTSGGAFLTIQKAIDTVYTLDLSIYDVTIQVADGTYSGSVAFKGEFTGKGTVTLNGNSTTPTNVIVSIPNSYGAFRVQDGVTVTLANFKIAPQAGTSAQNILVQNFATVNITGVDFAASGRAHIEGLNYANVIFGGAWTISGNAPMHVTLDAASNLTWSSQTVTAIGGTRTFSTCFLNVANRSGALIFGPTINGTFSGVRWLASLNATIKTNGAGANTNVPGSTNGTASTGGQTA